MGIKIKLKNVRLSYANLFKPRRSSKTDTNAKLVYGTSLLIPKNHPQIKELNDAVQTIGADKFGKKWEGIFADKNPVKDGDSKKYQDDPAYKGNWVINANSERKPQIVDRKLQEILSEDEIFSGCWVNASFNVYAFEGEANKGVTFGLNNIQFLKTGDRLGGVAGATEDFQIEDDDEEEDSAPAGFTMS